MPPSSVDKRALALGPLPGAPRLKPFAGLTYIAGLKPDASTAGQDISIAGANNVASRQAFRYDENCPGC